MVLSPGAIVNYYPLIGVRKKAQHAERICHRVFLVVSLEATGKSKVIYIDQQPQRRVWVPD